jgi:predicted RNA binding protein YcfA (HicA-like mRNA interferase family)
VKIPRDISGQRLAYLLEQYGYRITRQTGSHLRLTSNVMNREHSITIPKHEFIKIGTLTGILNEVSEYLEMDKRTLIEKLFKQSSKLPNSRTTYCKMRNKKSAGSNLRLV